MKQGILTSTHKMTAASIPGPIKKLSAYSEEPSGDMHVSRSEKSSGEGDEVEVNYTPQEYQTGFQKITALSLLPSCQYPSVSVETQELTSSVSICNFPQTCS